MSAFASAFVRGRVELVGSVLALALVATAAPPARGQTISDDFNDGNDNGWLRYAPLTNVPGVGVLAPANFSVTENHAYQMGSANPPSQAAGPARAGSLRADATYTDFVEQVDLTEWTGFTDQAVGLLARVTNYQGGQPGQLNGYAFTYSTGDNSLLLSRVVAEAPDVVGEAPVPVPLVVGQDYRLVFRGVGGVFTGELYDLNNLTTPLQTVTYTDTSPMPSGIGGLVAFSNVGTDGAGATFDNYLASPPPPVPEPTAVGSLLLAAAGAAMPRRRR
jgi:hypothetical protein